MGEKTGVGWTDHTGNFWWGCLKWSPGCDHCYAEAFSKRVGKKIWGPAKTTERWRTKSPWTDIFKWDKKAKADGVRRKVFVQSMSDFFEDHPQLVPWRAEACEILEQLEYLDVQLLTKRPENILSMVPASWREQWPAHVWAGTTVENQDVAAKRIMALRQVPAPILFLSCEPLLSELNLEDLAFEAAGPGWAGYNKLVNWVIVGGESGAKARPMNLHWAYSLVTQCKAAGIPVFVKQLGGHPDPRHDIAFFPQYLQVQEFPESE